MVKLGIIGTGNWGKALGYIGLKANCDVVFWNRSELLGNHSVGGQPVKVYQDINELKDCDIYFLCTSSKAIPILIPEIYSQLKVGTPVVNCAKGLLCIDDHVFFVSDYLARFLPDSPLAAISGPGYAKEVILNHPTQLTLASEDPLLVQDIMNYYQTPFFHLIPSTDMKGVQLVGAMKNIFAIACGMSDGAGHGDNGKALIMLRSAKEMDQFLKKIGGHKDTFLSPSGLGDLCLTCYSTQSRNYSLGFDIGQMGNIHKTDSVRYPLQEGVEATKSISMLARSYGLYLPIVEAVYEILFEGKAVSNTLSHLLKPSAQI